MQSYEGHIKNHRSPTSAISPFKAKPYACGAHVRGVEARTRSLATLHAILATALKAAVMKGMLRNNAASRAANKPCIPNTGDSVNNVWSADEARRALRVLMDEGPEWSAQDQALFALALIGS